VTEKWRFNGFYNKAQLARWREQIPNRVSCRNFSAAPKVSQWTTLSYAAARLCLPGVRILLAACDETFFTPVFVGYGRIKGATRFAAIMADTAVPRHMTHAGISGEAFVLEAASCGVATCWVGGSYRKKESPVHLYPGEVLAAVIPLGLAAEPKQEPVHRTRKPLKWFMENGGKDWPDYAMEAAKAVREAPSALNRQPWKLRMNSQSLSMIGAPNSLDTGIALLHMEAALFNKDRQWILDAGGRTPAARVLFTEDNDEE
jgi:nitroreductase